MRQLTATELHKSICLNFSGKVVRTPVKNALKVCQAFEMDFFVDGSSFDNYMSTDAFVPAWMCSWHRLSRPAARSGAGPKTMLPLQTSPAKASPHRCMM